MNININPFIYFRLIFGFYLMVHFHSLISHANELFGPKMPYNPELASTYMFPNLLKYINPDIYLKLLSILAIFYAYGLNYQLCAGFLCYGWASLVNRNPLIYNPGIPYVGYLLFISVFIKNNKIPKRLFWLSWFIMASGYTISGIHKLDCSSWIDGSALFHILEGPLARNNILRNTIIQYPILLKYITWMSLGLEISFLPLGMFKHTRLIFWLIYFFFHIGIILLINFTDLTLGVFMIHIFTFDKKWFVYFLK